MLPLGLLSSLSIPVTFDRFLPNRQPQCRDHCARVASLSGFEECARRNGVERNQFSERPKFCFSRRVPRKSSRTLRAATLQAHRNFSLLTLVESARARSRFWKSARAHELPRSTGERVKAAPPWAAARDIALVRATA
jgi:hypothetical protein